MLLTDGSQLESPKLCLNVVLEIFDPFHLIDSLVQPSNEIIHPSNGELNFQELENFTTHYNDDCESSGDEWKFDETDIVHLFETYLNYLKIRNHTVKPDSGHPLQRTPLYNRQFLQIRME